MADKSNKIKKYQDAVWDYILEHSDLLPNGNLFVKFHTDSRRAFENRILARWKYNYHRADPKKRDELHTETRLDYERKKWEAKERYLKNRVRGRRLRLWRRFVKFIELISSKASKSQKNML